VLELTPQFNDDDDGHHVRKGKGKAKEPRSTGWQTGKWGGWEVCNW